MAKHRPLKFVLSIAFIALHIPFHAYSQNLPANPATISYAGPTSGSIGYVSWDGTTTINAQIGRWDTPYPNADSGAYAPDLEPRGFSEFAIDINVNDGGLVSFRYNFETYDAGKWDWYDIYLDTPTGTIPIIEKLGKPGSDYGTYWQSPSIAISQSLDKWRNQNVRFRFRVAQDGWGDQSVGRVINFSIATCDVAPLTPITDASAQAFENGNNIDTANLNAATTAGLSCMQQSTTSLGGTFTLNSAYRPVAYQAHLREVWDTWNAIHNRTEAECQALKSKVQEEFDRHGLLPSQQPAAPNPNAPHSTGNAFDARITNLPSEQTVDMIASDCEMHRPWPVNDPVHYQPQ